ncbi:MAG TPA: hypothetical protein VGT05_00540 [Patescibacteria group bacterium]|nr:hypothetical protein [Patescibacteria group bacterium]
MAATEQIVRQTKSNIPPEVMKEVWQALSMPTVVIRREHSLPASPASVTPHNEQQGSEVMQPVTSPGEPEIPTISSPNTSETSIIQVQQNPHYLLPSDLRRSIPMEQFRNKQDETPAEQAARIAKEIAVQAEALRKELEKAQQIAEEQRRQALIQQQKAEELRVRTEDAKSRQTQPPPDKPKTE